MKQTYLGLFAIFIVLALWNWQVNPHSQIYQAWKNQYNIHYQTYEEDLYRSKIFIKNYLYIQQHNAKKQKTYELGINQFMAITNEEFQRGVLNSRFDQIVQKNNQQTFIIQNLGDTDWVSKGAVGPVKNMGMCSVSWAFTTTATIQTLYWVENQVLKSFSEQFLIDCCGNSNSCAGGFMTMDPFKCVKQKGIVISQKYPYKAQQGKCNATGEYFIGGSETVKGCSAISAKLKQNAVVVYVDATKWQFYKSGILSDCGTSVNHLATLVSQASTYWRLKNQWGTAWGQNGFIRIGPGNTCSVCYQGTIPLKK